MLQYEEEIWNILKLCKIGCCIIMNIEVFFYNFFKKCVNTHVFYAQILKTYWGDECKDYVSIVSDVTLMQAKDHQKCLYLDSLWTDGNDVVCFGHIRLRYCEVSNLLASLFFITNQVTNRFGMQFTFFKKLLEFYLLEFYLL